MSTAHDDLAAFQQFAKVSLILKRGVIGRQAKSCKNFEPSTTCRANELELLYDH
jgi:hypothetical protein